MNVKVEKTEKNNELKIDFEIEAEKFENAIQTVFNKNAKYFNIPGFRKGKAPFHIVEKQYGVQIFYEDAFNELVPEIYEQALKENNIEAVSKPEIEISQMEKGKDLKFSATVQTKPEVKLGKYKGIEIKKVEYNVSENDIEHELEHMAEHNSRLVTVNDRPVKEQDVVVIDFEGFVDGKPFDGGKAENHELTIGSKTFIPGFEEQIVGMKIDEEKDINVKFPDEYFSKDLAGKDATFKVKLHEIKVKELPKIDDEFAKDTSEFDTLSDLKNNIKERLEKQNKEREKSETENAAVDVLCENTEIDIPSGMIETEIDNAVEEVRGRLSYQGMKLEDYLKIINKTMDEFRKEYEEQARKSVKVRLIIEAISKDADIKVDEKEIEDKIKEMAEKYGRKEDELLNNENLKKYLEENLKAEKTVDYVVKNAKLK